jgi:Bacterial protein of unknown function (Gcw_chp).
MTRTALLAPLSAAGLLAGVLTASSALAQDWSFEVGAGTDNRSKSASKSGNDPYVFGAATWVSADGLFYVSPGVETIDSGGSDVEAEFVAGYQPEAFGYAFDFSVAYKNRLDAEAGYDEDTVEFTGEVSRDVGPASARLQVQYSPDAAGSTEAFTWVEGRLGWGFTNRLQGTVALGRREQDNAPDYTAWNAGVTYGLTDALDLDVRWYDTNATEFGEQYKSALVAEVAFAF